MIDPTDPIDLSGAQPAWSAEARAAWAEACRAAAAAGGMARPAYGGHPELRERIAARYGLPADEVTVVASVRAAAWSLGHQHRECFVESPSFPGVPLMLERAGARVHRFTWPDLDPPAGSLVVVTHPGRNPDGYCLDAAARARLEELLARGVRVVVNEAYREFAPAAPRVEGAEIMGSFHKIAGVGARTGFVSGGRFSVDSVPELAAAEPPVQWQAGWAGFIARGGLDLLRRDVVVPALRAVAAFDEALGEGPGQGPPDRQASHRLIALALGDTEQEAVEFLRDQGLQVVGGAAFAAPSPAIRLAFTGVDVDGARAAARLLLGSGFLGSGRLPERIEGGTR